jgi:hypothetical protein
MGEFTHPAHLPHSCPSLQDVHASQSDGCMGLPINQLRWSPQPGSNAARPLPIAGRRRVVGRPDWVKSPNPVRARWPSNHQHWEVEMRWTKPEAEVVAVTMEVTAYVATL